MTTKQMTAARLLILRTAAQRSDATVLPLPADFKVRGAALNRLLAGLITAGHIKEIKATTHRPCWRQADDGQRIGLRLTAAGKAARTVADDEARAIVDDHSAEMVVVGAAKYGSDGSPVAPKLPKGKLGTVAAAVGTDAGATLAELVTLTGWQAHTARAALTGLRQRGFPISLTECDGRKAYRITAAG